MRVYRISKRQYHHHLSGEGARLAGGRWNSKGIPIVYTSSSIAPATLEVMVHFNLKYVPDDLVLVEIDVPDDLSINTVTIKSLPEDWGEYPFSGTCCDIGDQWYQGLKSPFLQVPSAIIKNEFECNYLLNPLLPDFNNVSLKSVTSYAFDQRLIRP